MWLEINKNTIVNLENVLKIEKTMGLDPRGGPNTYYIEFHNTCGEEIFIKASDEEEAEKIYAFVRNSLKNFTSVEVELC